VTFGPFCSDTNHHLLRVRRISLKSFLDVSYSSESKNLQMPISNKIAHGLEEVDVIVCGGGVAACVVAGRLAAADPKLEILMIGGGENNKDKDIGTHPALFAQHLMPKSKTAVWYQAKKSDTLAGRDYILPTGGLIGGGSSINIIL
jgi:alcohol oxidase